MVLDVLVENESTSVEEITKDWIVRLLTDLPTDCAKWICSKYPLESFWTDQQKQKSARSLNQHIASDDIAEKESERYALVVSSFPATSLDESILAGHLSNACTRIQARADNLNDFLKKIVPVIFPILQHCDSATVGEMLQHLFTAARGDVALFAWLHGEIDGKWIEPNSSTGSYNPSQLFEFSVQTATSSPGTEAMGLVLKSLDSMNQSSLGPSDALEKLVDVACILWPHHPIDATDFLKSSNKAPTSKSIAELANGISVDSQEALARLRELWSFLAASVNQPEKIAVSTELLQEPPTNSEDAADISFSMWIDCCDESNSDVLRTLLSSEQLTDEQRMRVWLKADMSRKSLGRDWFLEALSSIMKLTEVPETHRRVIDSQSRINELFNSKSEHYSLGKTLLHASLVSTSNEARGGLLKWLHSLNVVDVLKELKNSEPIPQQSIDALKAEFPNSRHLKKVKVEQAEDTE